MSSSCPCALFVIGQYAFEIRNQTGREPKRTEYNQKVKLSLDGRGVRQARGKYAIHTCFGLENLKEWGQLGRNRKRWVDNIKTELQQIGQGARKVH